LPEEKSRYPDIAPGDNSFWQYVSIHFFFFYQQQRIDNTHVKILLYKWKGGRKIGRLEFFQIFSWPGKGSKVTLKSSPILLKKTFPYAYECCLFCCWWVYYYFYHYIFSTPCRRQ
jgi:hypothetical protein